MIYKVKQTLTPQQSASDYFMPLDKIYSMNTISYKREVFLSIDGGCLENLIVLHHYLISTL